MAAHLLLNGMVANHKVPVLRHELCIAVLQGGVAHLQRCILAFQLLIQLHEGLDADLHQNLSISPHICTAVQSLGAVGRVRRKPAPARHAADGRTCPCTIAVLQRERHCMATAPLTADVRISGGSPWMSRLPGPRQGRCWWQGLWSKLAEPAAMCGIKRT